ncbi:PREDICTED: coiled-coil domain-containing protein 183 isoform X1 [Lepidothrix coronata]|uniref:Coiled-coil domain-containing protein 183 isoform X1 n=1 Tax=Lepidothrix coronata TaxID=321398 RepID=A0A6J0HZ51_9PASS|nr:PREDICTED: coiled-coil domain-containing protein 183 isoform X1 [Lepidothrix coronata]
MVGPGTAGAGMGARGRGAAGTQGKKAGLDKRCRELRDLVSLQAQGLRIFSQSCEEKLRQNRQLLPSLQQALQEDARVLDFVLKYNRLPANDAFSEGKVAAAATESLEAAQKRLEAVVHDQVKVCDMLLHQVKQWSQARDDRQRYLQQLKDAELDDRLQQPQFQAIRQLGNDIEKMLMKIQTGQRVTSMYLQVQDIMRKELFYLPRYLDLMCGITVMYNEELTSRQNLKATDVIKKLMAEAGPQVLLERSLREQSLLEQRENLENLQQKTETERQLREQAASLLSADQAQSSSDATGGADAEAAMTQLEREAFVNDKMEMAKAALQCSSIWDIPGSLLAQLKSLEDLEQHIQECKENKQVLRQMLKELELKQARLKFHQPLSTTSLREEELRENLQREESRLEQLQAQMKRNQEQLIEFENSIDNLFVRLHSITMPDQGDSPRPVGLEEKLKQCEEKLHYLKQRVSDRPPSAQTYDKHSETFGKVRNLLEKSTASEAQNLKISFEDVGTAFHVPLDLEEEEQDYIPSRADIKKQGQQLVRMNTKRRKRK